MSLYIHLYFVFGALRSGEENTHENDDGFIEESIDDSSSLDTEFFNLLIEEEISPEEQTKTITLHQFKNLCNLISQVEKLKQTVVRLESVIKSKDKLIKELKIHNKPQSVLWENFSKLTTVISVFVYLKQVKEYLLFIMSFFI